jgi:hypothetical protein
MTEPVANFDSFEVSFTGKYHVDEPMGRLLRSSNAKRLLQAMQHQEAIIAQRQQEVEAIEDRIQRINEQHRLEMQYLMAFGVIASHRQEFQRILEEVIVNGGMRLQAAADLAYARSTPFNQSVKPEGRESSAA